MSDMAPDMPTSARPAVADAGEAEHDRARAAHWDAEARREDRWGGIGGAYRRRLTEVYRHHVPEGSTVLEVGCGNGALLAALRPSQGLGLDISGEMIARARAAHPGLEFVHGTVRDIPAGRMFDYVILSDVLNDVWDVQTLLEALAPHCGRRTRVLINSFSRVWQVPLAVAQALRLARRTLPQSWLTVQDVSDLLDLSGYEVLGHRQEVLWPVWTPLIGSLCNRVLARLWPFSQLGMSSFIVARRVPTAPVVAEDAKVSLIIAARNESGNIEPIVSRTPEMGGGTEFVFIEGHSTDDTRASVERAIAAHPDKRILLLSQPGRGKGDAVRAGFAAATGDVFIVYDADMTIDPRYLSRFYEALRTGKAEFANGVRLVYPMEDRAMRFFNVLGNKFFSLAFTWLLGQPVKDTLCANKGLLREDYERIAAGRAYFGEFDPFGDYDLLFGASKLDMRIRDIPIRYQARTYGTTNISRWRHGVLLLRMTAIAARRLTFR